MAAQQEEAEQELRDIFENAKLFERPKGTGCVQYYRSSTGPKTFNQTLAKSLAFKYTSGDPEYVDMSAFQNQKEEFSKRWGARNQDLNTTLKEYAGKRWVPADQVEALLQEIEQAEALSITSVEDQLNLVKLLQNLKSVEMYPQILKSLTKIDKFHQEYR